MIADTGTRPTCACGTPMIAVFDTGLYLCSHCDLPCPKLKGGCRLCAKQAVIRD